MQKFIFDIDIVGTCNLRCRSCPQGNIRDYRPPHGFMAPELLEKIIDKIKVESHVVQVNLFNWAEPLFHPQLPDLIRIIQNAGIPCHLSSNLNILPNADAIMAVGPASFKISVSGFSQAVYGYSHRGGNIEKVKKNMVDLVGAKKKNNASTRIFVNYHRYLHNLKEELQMREFAESLGIEFEPVWALMLPLEKILNSVDKDADSFPLTEEDRELIDCLALPFWKALKAANKQDGKSCRLQNEQVSLNFKGDVMLCCGFFDTSKYTLGNFLDLQLEEIQKLRFNHPVCHRCKRLGGHLYLNYGIDEMDELALANISQEDADLLDLFSEIHKKRLQKRLAKFHNRFLPKVLTLEQKKALGNYLSGLQQFIIHVGRTRFGKSKRS